MGGANSPKIGGGGEIFEFSGPLKLTSFYRDSIEILQFGGQKSKVSRGNFRGESPPPPPAFGTFCPPIPISEVLSECLNFHDRCESAIVFGSAADMSAIPCPAVFSVFAARSVLSGPFP